MKRRTILYVITPETPDDQISQAAEAAATTDAHLMCLMLGAAPMLPMYAYGVPPYGGMNIPDNWTETVADAQVAQTNRVQAVEKLLAASNVSGDVQSTMCATLDVKHVVAQYARVSDEAFFAPSLREMPDFLREAASGILFHSPIAFRMNGAAAEKVDRVMIAWDSSSAAASAVHAALPYLKEASEVVIACIDPVAMTDRDGPEPGADVAAWLSHHGCHVTVSQFPSGGRDVGQCILDRAQENGSGLVVMGAYGHARMIQTVLGGTTRTMMDQKEQPVLFAH
ncbi:UspA domain protein [Sulfitobacter noctilucicola]|uniref:Nucleotide-binding universal stress UspA family protein n=1 Tax=Sulfitobacter noctilucicola TaxID=1342301 RepID=A0A7W6Q4J9_9RHOB|nr:universal stress protein [Sulfitobacter noctilucicola]KIN62672.1 UspA domain protein [Sulfitobacter noctilucicola]MBB4172795.1 nucleotide-binding universal stress UspA family protein [Sulfitobacter noctilucicola]